MSSVEIIPFKPELAKDFGEINRQWIADMFVVEDSEEAVLSDPITHIIEPGGFIFLGLLKDRVVGAGALKFVRPGYYELTKMGVLPEARGHKVGEKILLALIEKASELGAECLFLLTNKKCEAAIHLYEKFGFRHDSEIMENFGASYERCNVAMRYVD